MKVLAAAAALLPLIAVPAAHAELDLSLRMEYGSVLQYEPTYAYITIRNKGLLPFVIDRNGLATEINFNIRGADDDSEVATLKHGSVVTDWRVEPGETRVAVVDLTSWYDIRDPRRYFVAVELTQHGHTLTTRSIAVDVVPGIELTKTTLPVFGVEGVSRTYSLRYWARAQREYLFLRVDESPTKLNYGVIQLGSVLRLFKPQLDVDHFGKITVLHQASAGLYVHSSLQSHRYGVRFESQRYLDKDLKPWIPEGDEAEAEPEEEDAEDK